jgi:hypothetical protein
MDTPAYRQTQPVAAASPGAAAAQAPPPPPAVSGNSHRGLYIALGAFIVVAVLFAAGLYLPSRIKTMAGAGKTAVPQPSQQASPATSTDTVTPSSAPPASTNPAAPTAAAAATAAAIAQAPQSGQSSPDSSSASSATDAAAAANATPSSGGTPPVPPKKPSAGKSKKDSQAADEATKAEEAAQAEEVEKRYDDVDSRSSAVSQSLDNLQRQQAASGYGLRGDIVSAQQRMKTDLSKAQFAMQKQDTKAAKKYLEMAEAELQTLEKFLGR